MRKNSLKQINTERVSMNKENVYPIQAHYKQYLQQ